MKTDKTSTTKSRKNYTIDDKDRARRYYLMGLNLQEISLLLGGCPTRTLEKWQSAERWTQLKSLESIKIRAFKLYQAGKPQKVIAQMLGVCTVTVWRYITEVKESEDVKEL